ncbi:MAG TPA: hypothetical protein DCQ06_11510 [Myxococcales bacterium]|nr:hypothetical protein [Myxococcales bacterium]
MKSFDSRGPVQTMRPIGFAISSPVVWCRSANSSKKRNFVEFTRAIGGALTGLVLTIGWPLFDLARAGIFFASEDPMSRPVRIALLGQTFTLRTDETDEHIQAVAALVDERLRELKAQGAPTDRTLGLFAALTLADELLKARERSEAIDERLRAQIELLDRALDEDHDEDSL